MKIAIINDLHFGVKNDSLIFLDYQKEFYDKVFFPTLNTKQIKNVSILGDSFDKRKVSNHQTIESSKQMLFNPLYDKGIDTNILIGNHDSMYANKLSVNSPRLLLSEFSNINIIDSPLVIKNILYVPWICESNYNECMQMIKKAGCSVEYCFGHFELSGFFNNSHVLKDAMSPTILKRFKHVYSAHYHDKQTIGNVTYTGSPYQLTFADVEKKGFHIFDDETGELEFIENPYKMFHTITYSENEATSVPNISGKIVKLIVKDNTDKKKYEKFLEFLNNQNPFELKINDTLVDHDELEEDIDLDIDTTDTVIKKYIDNSEVSLDKNRLNDIFKSLLSEAQLL
ncbi:MAG: metallophosphoesterase [Bacilli bacterium]|nr:metallophosphoesterase [Bacilli bacterium]